MSATSQPTAARPPQPLASPLFSAMFLAFSTLAFLRIALHNRILDLVMDYTGDGGSIVSKIHPATWGLAAVSLIVVLHYRIDLTAWERQLVRAILGVSGVAAGLIVFVGITGHGASTGYLVDTYILLVTIIPLLAFPPAWRRQLGYLLFAYLVLGALVGLAEFATRTHVLAYAENEAAFRPLGLTNHPLAFGQACVSAMCLACGLKRLGNARWGLVALLVVAIVVSGARIATITGGICLLVYLIAVAGEGVGAEQRRRRRLAIVLATVIVAPALLAALLAAGALTRFESGLMDANATSRVDIYSILGLLSTNELFFGADVERIRKSIQEEFGYESIESSLLVFVVQFGVVGTALFVGTLVWFARTLCRDADLPIVLLVSSFGIVALSNNALSIKSTDVFLVTLLGIAFHPTADRRGAG